MFGFLIFSSFPVIITGMDSIKLLASFCLFFQVSTQQRVQSGSRYDPSKCTKSYYDGLWQSTGVVPKYLSQPPPAPLYMRYNGKSVFPNDIVTNEDMNRTPMFKWDSEPGSLYTILINDFGIERLQGAQFFHWLVTNVPDPRSVNSGVGDEVTLVIFVSMITDRFFRLGSMCHHFPLK